MVDYYALISPTIEPLADATPEERQVVYRRLVDVLDQQLRAATPPRSDKDILKERIELESAIRRIERHILARQKTNAPVTDRPIAPPQEPAIPTSPLPRLPRTLSPLAVPQVEEDQEAERRAHEERERLERLERERLEREREERERLERAERERLDREVEEQRSSDETQSLIPSYPEEEDLPLPSLASPFDKGLPKAVPFARIPETPAPFDIPVTPAASPVTDTRDDEGSAEAPDVPVIPVAPRSLFSRAVANPSKTRADDQDRVKESVGVEKTPSVVEITDVIDIPAVQVDAAKATPSWMRSASETQEDMVTPAPRDDLDQRANMPTTGIILTAQKVERIQHKGLILRISIVVLVLMGLLAAVGSIAEFLGRNATESSSTKNTESASASVTASVKFQDRLPLEPDTPSDTASKGAAGTKGQDGSETPPAANNPIITRAVFIEEPGAGIGEARRTEGRVTWKLETLPTGANGKADLGVRATVDLTDVGLAATFLFRKNRDLSSSDAYLIEVEFQSTGDPANGKIRDVSLPEMRSDEKARGATLAGIPVPVSDNVFLVGLKELDADITRNLDLMRRQNWFLFPLRYATGKRAVLLFEKGKTGDRVFEDALQAWK